MKPGDLIVNKHGQFRLVVAVQPRLDPGSKEFEVLLMCSGGSTRWCSSSFLSRVSKKVNTEDEAR